MTSSIPFPPTIPSSDPSSANDIKITRSRWKVLLHALPESDLATNIIRYLEDREIVLYAAQFPEEIARAYRREHPAGLILPAQVESESAWLVTAKLRAFDPDVRVVVLCDEPTTHHQAIGRFVGAKAVFPVSVNPAMIGRYFFGPNFGGTNN